MIALFSNQQFFLYGIIAAIVAVLYAGALYYRHKFKGISAVLPKLFFALRFAAVFLLVLLVLSPLLKSVTRSIEKPILVFAQDNSRSLLIANDSAYYQDVYQKKIADWIAAQDERYDVEFLTFGEKITEDGVLSLNERETDYIQLVDELEARYSNRNLGAVVLATDGNYTRGANPLYKMQRLATQIYPLVLGDTTALVDAMVKQVRHNEEAYVGTFSPVRVLVQAGGLAGKNADLALYQGDKLLEKKSVKIDKADFSEIFNFSVEMTEAGNFRYKVELTPIVDEQLPDNNRHEFAIRVIEQKQRVLLLAHAPHPDLGVLRRMLDRNLNIEADIRFVDQFDGNMSAYHLIYLHQLPDIAGKGKQVAKKCMEQNIPLLIQIGQKTGINSFNQLNSGLQILQRNQAYEFSQANVNISFTGFSVTDEQKEWLEKVPPLYAPFGDYKQLNGTETILYKKYRNISTGQPLVLVNKFAGASVGIIAGEGIWRWALNNFQQYENHVLFNTFFQNFFQILMDEKNREEFAIRGLNSCYENQNILITTQLALTDNSQIEDAQISIAIKSEEEDSTVNFDLFESVAGNYSRNIGQLAIGKYSYQALAKLKSGQILEKQGDFHVLPNLSEMRFTKANVQLLNLIGRENQGRVFDVQQLDSLPLWLADNESVAAIGHTAEQVNELINFRWLFFLILAFLTAEWILRKYHGGV